MRSKRSVNGKSMVEGTSFRRGTRGDQFAQQTAFTSTQRVGAAGARQYGDEMISGRIKKGDRLKGPGHKSERVVIGFARSSDGRRWVVCELKARKWDGTPTGALGVEVEWDFIVRKHWERVG